MVHGWLNVTGFDSLPTRFRPSLPFVANTLVKLETKHINDMEKSGHPVVLFSLIPMNCSFSCCLGYEDYLCCNIYCFVRQSQSVSGEVQVFSFMYVYSIVIRARGIV